MDCCCDHGLAGSFGPRVGVKVFGNLRFPELG